MKLKTWTVARPIVVIGLEGQVSVESRCVHTLFSHDHILEYRSDVGVQLRFEFQSKLLEDNQIYRVRGAGTNHHSDTIVDKDRTWHHIGVTNADSDKPKSGTAEIITPGEMTVGSCEIKYSIRTNSPKSKRYTSKRITVPLT